MTTAIDLFSEYERTSARPSAPPVAVATIARAVAAELPSFAGVIELLERAREAGLKYPKLRLQLEGAPLHLHIAGERSRTPGYAVLTDGGRYPDNRYYGRISPRGELELGRDGHSKRGQLVELLARLAQDPAAVAAEYGRLTGQCCFCKRGLEDARSVSVGYGPVCAEKYGLPWGEG